MIDQLSWGPLLGLTVCALVSLVPFLQLFRVIYSCQFIFLYLACF